MKRYPILVVLAALSVWAFTAAAAEPEANINDDVDIKELNMERNTGHFVYATAGPGIVVSEIEVDYLYSGEPNFSGQLKVGYEWISNKKIGIGFLYSGYYTGFTNVVPTSGGWSSAKIKEHMAFNYFGPQFAGRVLLKSPKWSLRYSVGLGLLMFYDGMKQDGKFLGQNYDYGVGGNLTFGVIYHVTSRIGITAAISYVSGIAEQSYMGVSQTSGFDRSDIDFGLTYRF